MRIARLAALLTATVALAALSAPLPAAAAEGMWTLDKAPLEKIQKETGAKLDAKWLERARLGAVRLAGGCSGSLVSGEGLVLTNHHCITDCLSDLSTPQDNLLGNGFLASSRVEERRCAGTEINQLVAITDVTEKVEAATKGKAPEAFAEARRAATAEIEKACTGGDKALRCDVVTLYQGGRYHLYRYKRYADVRLVFAPEAALGAFGGDPDNFNFPRWTLDMALLRVYGADGKPIASPEHFKWSKTGAKAGDAAFVVGHPGGTSRLDAVSEVTAVRDSFLPDTMLYLAEKRGRLLEFARRGPEEARVVQSDIQSIENGIKVWRGRQQALHDPAFFGRLVEQEIDLRQAIAKNPELSKMVGDAYGEIEEAVRADTVLQTRFLMLERLRGFDSTLYSYARPLVRAAEETAKPNSQRLIEYTESRLPGIRQRLSNPAPISAAEEEMTLGFSLSKLREALGVDDPLVKAILGTKSPEQVAAELVKATKLGDKEERLRLLEGGAKAIAASDDPMIRLAKLVDVEARKARKEKDELNGVIERAQARIAKARFAIYGETVAPDATFSLRLSYGTVKGWTEKDGKEIAPFTDFAGLYARTTGVDPFLLTPKWLAAKDKIKLATPLNGVSDNDIIGGNSGSPILNDKLEVIGLIFDGNIHSLAGEYGYDGRRNRSVWVDARGMAEALSKVYGAKALVTELGL